MNTQPIEMIQETPEEFATRLIPNFTNLLLLSRALTHRSYLNEHPEALEDNERLEFLGDAVLDFVVGAWLYHKFPEMPEGDLTRMRSALVYTEQLAEFARGIGLGRVMRLGRGELRAGGRQRSGLLCDTFEAVIGAIYLDQNIAGVLSFIEPLLTTSSADIILNHKDEDPKSKLQEWAQGKGYPAPQYVTKNTSGPDHSKLFEVDVYINSRVTGNGMGHSKQNATKQAAINALENMGLLENASQKLKEN
ncbi:MAG: ribonuclease III [Chloroflexi bacterium]|nr:ribonuclease III [Chloroflexota bacterium]